MRFRDALPCLFVLILRLSFLSPSRWALDWIAVLALLWIALALTREKPHLRNWSLGMACSWLTLIYAIHQGPWTLAGWH